MERVLPDIPYEEVLHYLGCTEVDEQTKGQILHAIDKAKKLAKPKIVYQIVRIKGCENDLGIPLHGHDIEELLATCDQAVFMAATLGSAMDTEVKRLSIQDLGDMLIFDAVCNAAIEAVADAFQEELRLEFNRQGRYLSDRFSCGYGDLSISIQHQFCEALDTRRKIGLFVNASSLLLPLKSITAIIGISKEKQQKRITGCEYCDLKDTCLLRKGGTRCGK